MSIFDNNKSLPFVCFEKHVMGFVVALRDLEFFISFGLTNDQEKMLQIK